MKRLVYIIITALVLGISTHAWALEWTLDKNHSTVQFRIKHIVSTVFGRFSDFDGSLRYDPTDPENSRFDFTVQVASVDTGNTKRDTHLRSGDFFAEGRFPEMRFVSSGITRKDANTYLVKGTMTIKDVTQQMTVPVVFHGTFPNPLNKSQKVAGFDTEFSLNRLDFGVGTGKFHRMGVVGKTVEVRISVEALASP